MSVAFADLQDKCCSWPMDAGSGRAMLVCGAPRGSHKSYCDTHAIAAGGSAKRLAVASAGAIGSAATTKRPLPVRALPAPAPTPQRPVAVSPTLPSHGRDNVVRSDSRPVAALDLKPKPTPNRLFGGGAPLVRMVAPASLLIEPAYQRDLSARSIGLIRRIVENFDWARFKPPIVAETEDGLFVIDGQHTAIAAATHPDVKNIPVLVVSASRVEARASAFVSHNRDRLVMSPFQIFHAEAAASDPAARAILKILAEHGASIPRSPALKGYAKPGQIVSVNEVRAIYKAHGDKVLRRLIGIATKANLAPIGVTITRALRMILTEPIFASVARLPDDAIVAAINTLGDLEVKSVAFAHESGQGRHRACAVLIAQAAGVALIGEAA